MHNRRVFIDDPTFLPGNSTGLLRAKGASVKAPLRADDADFFRTALFNSVSARQLDGIFRRFRTGREQENFVQTFRRESDQILCQRGAFFTRKNIVVKQPAVDLVDDGLLYLGRAVSRVRDQHAGTPVEPAIAVFVVNGAVLGAFPDKRRLAAHGNRLEFSEFF